MIHVKPATNPDGGQPFLVRDGRGNALPAAGHWTEDSNFWRRRALQGDVVLTETPVVKPVATPA